MGLTERHALAHHPLRQVRRESEARRGQLAHTVLVEGQGGHQASHRRQQQVQLCHRVDDRFLVLLQIAVVRQWQALEGGHQAGEVADQTARLASHELRDVRVLLLRHDRGAGGPGIGERDVPVLRGAPVDNLLGQSRHVHRDLCEDEGRLGGEVAGGGAVQGVIRRGVEAELLRDGLRVQLQRGTSQRARAIGRDSQALVQVLQALNIAQQRLGVSQQ